MIMSIQHCLLSIEFSGLDLARHKLHIISFAVYIPNCENLFADNYM